MPQPLELTGLPIAESGPSFWGHHRDEACSDCPRLYYYEFEYQGVGLESTTVNWNYQLGRAYHKFLATWYLGLKHDADMTKVIVQAYDDGMSELGKGLDLKASRFLENDYDAHSRIYDELLTGYVQKYPSEPTWRILDVEKEIAVVISGEIYTFRVDLVIETIDTGRRLVVDHKGTGQWASMLWKQYELDDQLTGYTKAVSMTYGKTFDGFLINGLGKPSERRRGGFPWYDRQIFLRSDRDIDRWLRNRQMKRQVIRTYQAAGFWPMNTTSCTKWGRDCAFKPLCLSHEGEAEMASLYTLRKKGGETAVVPDQAPNLEPKGQTLESSDSGGSLPPGGGTSSTNE
jgi:hypothetical protein